MNLKEKDLSRLIAFSNHPLKIHQQAKEQRNVKMHEKDVEK